MLDTLPRPAGAADQDFLWTMLFEASHAAEQGFSSTDGIRSVPALARYAENWGGSVDDLGVVGQAPDGRLQGAAWLRRFTAATAAYGYIDDDTPELVIAVASAARGTGLGTALLTRLLQDARPRCRGVCLNVRTENPAHRLYGRLGFVDVAGSETTNWAGTTSVTMVLRFP
ncbi:GNAT family N-acetyltransferase [Rhodococcus sp. NPDC059234]|uniref:GNAT family N-acetyltransferase n=1 Tax=Rhodococcus sp. NPDC059234 TaxID=3346781 RepID=UPI00366EC2B9